MQIFMITVSSFQLCLNATIREGKNEENEEGKVT